MTIECAFTGRLGGPQMQRYTKAGKKWLALSLATKTGGNDGVTEWVSVAIFEPLTEEVPQALPKGTELYIEGKLRMSRWNSGDEARATLQVTASRIVVLGQIGRRKPKREKQEKQPAQESELQYAPDDDNIIPFDDVA